MSAQVVIVALQIAVLIYIAVIDVAVRLIPNTVCLLLAGLGITSQLLINGHQLLVSFFVAGLLFFLLLLTYRRGWVGGGDIKLLVALAIGLPAVQLLPLLTVIALAGGGLGLAHLVLRRLPYPSRPPTGASCLRRVYAVERWRNLRHAPLPYGVAIASGAIWTILTQGT